MGARKAVNLTIDEALLARARAEGLNLSAELEQTVRAKVARIEAERWRRENADALALMMQRIEAEGVAGDDHRTYG